MEIADVEIDIAKPKPKPSKGLIAAVVILAIAVVILLVLVILYAVRVIPPQPPKPCSTRACTEVSGRMLSSMNLSADPCTDWFEYACGGYTKKSFIPIGQYEASPFTNLINKLNAFFGDQLSDSPSSINTDDPPAFQNLKELYQGCRNKTKRNELGLEPIKSYIKKFGGLGLDGTFKAAEFDLTKLITSLTQYMTLSQPFVFVLSFVNPYNTRTRELAVFPPGLWDMLPAEEAVLKKNIFEDIYKQYLGKAPDANKVNNLVKVLMDFQAVVPKFDQTNLASAFQTNMTLEELSKICCDGLDWPKFLSTLLGKKVDKTYRVYVASPDTLKGINAVMKKTSKETLNDLAMTAYLLGSSTYLGVEKENPANLENCLKVLKDVMRPALESLFLKKFYTGTQETRREVTDMMTNVFDAFLENVLELTWLGKDTKDKIKLKASRTARLISNPPILTNITWVDEHTPKGISRDEYFDGVMTAMFAKQKFLMSTAGTEWTGIMSPSLADSVAEVNAYFAFLLNVFQISAGIIAAPVFTNGAPMYVNYGALGSIVGHEITHGYDNTGQQYGPDGVKQPWWLKSELDEFKKKTQCFVDEFSKLTVHLEKENKTYTLNGTLTLGENIADAGGIRAGFKGYEIWRKENGDEPMLVGMPKSMTWQKLFFLSTVQPFCEIVTEKGMEGLLVDVHTPPIARVRTWVMNTDDFSTAFSCPVGSPMNPKKKCKIW